MDAFCFWHVAFLSHSSNPPEWLSFKIMSCFQLRGQQSSTECLYCAASRGANTNGSERSQIHTPEREARVVQWKSDIDLQWAGRYSDDPAPGFTHRLLFYIICLLLGASRVRLFKQHRPQLVWQLQWCLTTCRPGGDREEPQTPVILQILWSGICRNYEPYRTSSSSFHSAASQWNSMDPQVRTNAYK